MGGRRRRAEVRDGAPAHVAEGARPQRSRDDVDIRTHHAPDRSADVLPPGRGVSHRHDDQVREKEPVLVQVTRRQSCILISAHDHDGPVGRDGRQRRPAAVEDDDVRVETGRNTRAGRDVRRRHATGESAAAATAPHSGDPDQGSRLEMVGRRVAPAARELDERVDGRSHDNHLGLGRPAPSHRHHDDAAVHSE